jgi:hypothetical protein
VDLVGIERHVPAAEPARVVATCKVVLDPTLVHHYFGDKEGPFIAAMELMVDSETTRAVVTGAIRSAPASASPACCCCGTTPRRAIP